MNAGRERRPVCRDAAGNEDRSAKLSVEVLELNNVLIHSLVDLDDDVTNEVVIKSVLAILVGQVGAVLERDWYLVSGWNEADR